VALLRHLQELGQMFWGGYANRGKILPKLFLSNDVPVQVGTGADHPRDWRIKKGVMLGVV
jgi:hypothetical protein